MSFNFTRVSDNFFTLSGDFDILSNINTDISIALSNIYPVIYEISGFVTDISFAFDDISATVHRLEPSIFDLSAFVTDISFGFDDISATIHRLEPSFFDLSGFVSDISFGFDDISDTVHRLEPSFEDLSASFYGEKRIVDASTVLYVNNTYANPTPGGTLRDPFTSINGAIAYYDTQTILLGNLKRTWIIKIYPGVYEESVTFSTPNVIVEPHVGESAPTIDGERVVTICGIVTIN